MGPWPGLGPTLIDFVTPDSNIMDPGQTPGLTHGLNI